MTETSYFSREEVSKNDGKNTSKIWLIIKEGVYDVTSYLEEHPGGRELLEEHAGKDATKAFNDNGHSSDARKKLESFRIGQLQAEDLKNLGSSKTSTSAPRVVEHTEPAQKKELYEYDFLWTLWMNLIFQYNYNEIIDFREAINRNTIPDNVSNKERNEINLQ